MSDIDLSKTIDQLFTDGLVTDNQIFDGKVTLVLIHKTEKVPDFTTGTISFNIEEQIVKNCVYRQKSNRNTQSVRQIRERMEPIQNDSFDKYDVVIEMPILPDLKIFEGDEVRDDNINRRWIINAIDYSTMNTRYRLGCNQFK